MERNEGRNITLLHGTPATPEGLVCVAVAEDRLAEVPGERGHGGGCGGGGGAGETEQLVAVLLLSPRCKSLHSPAARLQPGQN